MDGVLLASSISHRSLLHLCLQELKSSCWFQLLFLFKESVWKRSVFETRLKYELKVSDITPSKRKKQEALLRTLRIPGSKLSWNQVSQFLISVNLWLGAGEVDRVLSSLSQSLIGLCNWSSEAAAHARNAKDAYENSTGLLPISAHFCWIRKMQLKLGALNSFKTFTFQSIMS